MGRNVEIKARVDNVASLLFRISSVADRGPTEIPQDDIFFECPNGRFKLRIFSPSSGELIFYQRPDVSGPKEARYSISPTAAPESLRKVLAAAYGECGRVRKHRIIFHAGQTRIHLDRVENLGHFLELEVVLGEDETTEKGVTIAHDLLARLGIPSDHLIEGAYVDLLQKQKEGQDVAPAQPQS